ncbi:unnamed protein product [Acanthosepion pharaonis]|uniref:Uncharacterized protein n=1 Tax=Acanthosepion pharaonis TaxID=158019 RepID=A0A812EK48_ACAPH|nr:unnamed protein product [Sepia pharaonis]
MAVHYTTAHPQYRFLILVAVHYTTAHPQYRFLILVAVHYTTRTSQYRFLPGDPSTVPILWLFIIPPVRPQYRFPNSEWLFIIPPVWSAVPTLYQAVPQYNSGTCLFIPPVRPQYRFLILVAVHYTTRTSTVPISNSGGCSLYHPHVHSTDF